MDDAQEQRLDDASDREDTDILNNNRRSVYFSAHNVFYPNEAGPVPEETVDSDTNLGRTEDMSSDFVLVYKTAGSNKDVLKRKHYEGELKDKGLKLSTEQHDDLTYVKIHAPTEVLCQYCEMLKMRKPIKSIPGLNVDQKEKQSRMRVAAVKFSEYIEDKLEVDTDKKTPKWCAEFSRDKDYLFDADDEDFFSMSDKCMIVNFILERTQFSAADLDMGIAKLLNDGVYKAAYPLHDGSFTELGTERQFFYSEWAALSKVHKYQPLDRIRNYFGVKFGLYFAWLGFYTMMLIPASVVGLLCTVYGWWTLADDQLSADACSLNFTMCPQCDAKCDYWDSTDACTYAKVTHLFDNAGTYAFTVFMSVWSALYLEFWKRYCARINHRWGLTEFDADFMHPRPQYLIRFAGAKKEINYVTNREEPVVPFFRIRLPTMVLSFSFALVWISLAGIAVFGVVIYRMTGIAADLLFTGPSSSRFSSFIVPVTAAVINLTCIFVLNAVYNWLALVLTEYECHRTQVEFDNSLTLKIYLFQFVNFYSSISYVAFLKGKFVGYPAKYNRVFGYRQEECSLGECLMELFIQLAIIMVGKQALNAVMEYGVPKIKAYMARRRSAEVEDGTEAVSAGPERQWVEDYRLMGLDSRGMFAEYLEMVIQYGFVTIFVAAFPMAPLFALINNIFEMRLDAKKYVKFYRRPVSQRVKDIGIWFYIIEILGKLSIASNAFIIAFSSNFIPTLVYNTYHPGMGESGFLNYSLSYFDVRDFEAGAAPTATKYTGVTQCRYSDYRSPPWEPAGHRYKKTLTYWHILAARLAFVVVYQNLVGVFVTVVQWLVPDTPKALKKQIKRETLLVNEYILKKEQGRAKSAHRL